MKKKADDTEKARLSEAEFLLAISLRHLPESEFWRVYRFLKAGWKLPKK